MREQPPDPSPTGHDSLYRWTGILPTLPVAVRVLLTAFLAIIGLGYLVAIANIYERHQLADGKPGLSLDDLRAVYSGLTVAASAKAEVPSRMLTMIRGEMRQYISDESDFAILESWLKAGASKEGLTAGPPKKTPQRVISRNCLRCHAKSTDTEISKKSPFGADEFDVDYAMISPLLAASSSAGTGMIAVPPQYTMPRLILVSHQHMLTIPMFTLVVALLFMMTRLPAGARSILAPIPMIATAIDFSGWWLARLSPAFLVLIVVAGALYGLVLGVQIIVIAVDLWRPSRS